MLHKGIDKELWFVVWQRLTWISFRAPKCTNEWFAESGRRSEQQLRNQIYLPCAEAPLTKIPKPVPEHLWNLLRKWKYSDIGSEPIESPFPRIPPNRCNLRPWTKSDEEPFCGSALDHDNFIVIMGLGSVSLSPGFPRVIWPWTFKSWSMDQ